MSFNRHTFVTFIGKLCELTEFDQIRWHEPVFQRHTTTVRMDGKKFSIVFAWPKDGRPHISVNGRSLAVPQNPFFEKLQKDIYSYYKQNNKYGYGERDVRRRRKARKEQSIERRRKESAFEKVAEDFLDTVSSSKYSS